MKKAACSARGTGGLCQPMEKLLSNRLLVGNGGKHLFHRGNGVFNIRFGVRMG